MLAASTKAIYDYKAISDREKQVLHLVSFGYSDTQTAFQLFLSVHIIHSHRKSLMKKLAVTKTAALVRRGFEVGLLHLNCSANRSI